MQIGDFKRFKIGVTVLYEHCNIYDVYMIDVDEKKTVEELGLLWGIYDLELANQFKGDYDLKELTGRYGLQCQD